MTFWMKILIGLKYLLKNPQIYEIIPIELFVDMKIIKVACKIMLKILVPLNVYFKINLKGYF
jgi:hypothetical protein